MKEHLEALGYHVEVYDKPKLPNEFSDIDMDNYTIIHFDLEGGSHLNLEYYSFFDTIKSECAKAGVKFFFTPKVDLTSVDWESLLYFSPQLKGYIDNPFNVFSFGIQNIFTSPLKTSTNTKECFSRYITDYNKILDYFGYDGNIKSGLIIIEHSRAYFIDYDDVKDGVGSPVLNVLKGFNIHGSYDNFSRHNFNEKLEEELDDEARNKIKDIEDKLKELKESGVLMTVLPLIKETLKKYEKEVKLNTIAELHIDDDYKITIPDYNNMEVQLGHLTKAIYILFFNHPQGIDVKKLYLYRDELIKYYLSISYQENVDKMNQSIFNLTAPDSKAIYTHISRIKSAFYSLMDKSYANKYIVTGSYGESLKYIPLIYRSDNNCAESLDFDIVDDPDEAERLANENF